MARRITIIAAHAKNRVIGNEGEMAWHISADLKHFKATTMGHPMIMGRKTWQSWGSKPLPGRRHILISRNADFTAEGAEVVTSLDDALALTAGDDVFIVGGAQIYAMALPVATHAIISEIPLEPEGDAYFPELSAGWVVEEREQKEGFEIVRFRHDLGATEA